MENKLIRKQLVKKSKRVVLKIGTNVISDRGKPASARIERLSTEIDALIKMGKEVIIVTSGAIGLGANVLLPAGVTPKTIPMKQACASVGQPILMNYYREYFKKSGYTTGQILLTNDILKRSSAFKNARNTMLTLIEKKSIPIVNENDSVSVEEIKFGDNDRLAAVVSLIVGADVCVLLSDIDAFYINFNDKEKCERMSLVKEIDDAIMKEGGVNNNSFSTGGMKTKLLAGKTLTEAGIDMVIINGKKENELLSLFNGDDVGTIFSSKKNTLSGTRRWLSEFADIEGSIDIDEGAYNALIDKGKSLLPSGIINVSGNFDSGSAVGVNFNGQAFAKGISWYSSEDIMKIKGKKTSEINQLLGFKDYDEVIHRNNLLIKL